MPRKRNLLLGITTLAFFLCASFSGAEVVDKILVIVNDEIITQGDLDRIMIPIYTQYRMVYRDEELAQKIDTARKNILERLITDKLLLSEARRRKIEVKDAEVEESLEEIRKRFTTEEEFNLVMAKENIAIGELEKIYKERMMIDNLIDLEIERKVAVTPMEIVTFYQGHKDMFGEPKKAKVRSILIRVSDDQSEEEALRRARELRSRLKEGGNFALLAEEYSEGPYAKSGGDMGWVKEGELMDRINKLVFSLDAGEISGVLSTNLGFHIFMLEEISDARVMEFSEAKPYVERIVVNQKIEKQLGDLVEQLKKNAYIAFR